MSKFSFQLDDRPRQTDTMGPPWYNIDVCKSNRTTLDYSIIIPAKNEEHRIGETLSQLGGYIMEQGLDKKTEVIVVINNSKDNTLEVVKEFEKEYTFISYIYAPFYTGKGGAVNLGVQYASGQYIGFVDADGALQPEQVFNLISSLKSNMKLGGVIASRYIKHGTIIGDLPKTRTILSRIFNKLVKFGFGMNYSDTQCGYKFFTKRVAKEIFHKTTTNGWIFDVNLLLLSKYYGFRIDEIPVVWRAIDGSTLNIFGATFNVVREIVSLYLFQIAFVAEKIVQTVKNPSEN